ncbi:MAG: hypothetical protein HC914_18170, partial [Chloroflexaceae bacterium]|nr:hypothetical protein [Chloroflexaceae bacterium]
DSLPVRTTTPDLLDMERVETHLALAVERGRYRGPTDALDYLLHRQCLVRVGDALYAPRRDDVLRAQSASRLPTSRYRYWALSRPRPHFNRCD